LAKYKGGILEVEIIFDVIKNTLVAELFGELDHHAAEKARDKIDEAVDNYGVQNLIFDFTNVSFMDSSGIGMVLGRYRKMNETEKKIAIVSCSKAIRNILNMAGVFSLMDYYNTKEEAIAGLDRKEVS
jgi:stage II sporulation protein AA (anti-sigma F factor antagonist)